MMAVIRDPHYVAHADQWLEDLTSFLHRKIATTTSLERDDFTLEFRLIGRNAALGALEDGVGTPLEVGVLLIITAMDQETATDLSKVINPFLLHHPLTAHEDLPTFAFPYSPAHTDRGALYEFAMNHVLEISDPMDGFTLAVDEVVDGKAG
jgi:hypothetical protein